MKQTTGQPFFSFVRENPLHGLFWMSGVGVVAAAIASTREISIWSTGTALYGDGNAAFAIAVVVGIVLGFTFQFAFWLAIIIAGSFWRSVSLLFATWTSALLIILLFDDWPEITVSRYNLPLTIGTLLVLFVPSTWVDLFILYRRRVWIVHSCTPTSAAETCQNQGPTDFGGSSSGDATGPFPPPPTSRTEARREGELSMVSPAPVSPEPMV